MSYTALVVLLYLALDVARVGKAGSYSAAAPEPQRSLRLFSLMSGPPCSRSLEAGASSCGSAWKPRGCRSGAMGSAHSWAPERYL